MTRSHRKQREMIKAADTYAPFVIAIQSAMYKPRAFVWFVSIPRAYPNASATTRLPAHTHSIEDTEKTLTVQQCCCSHRVLETIYFAHAVACLFDMSGTEILDSAGEPWISCCDVSHTVGRVTNNLKYITGKNLQITWPSHTSARQPLLHVCAVQRVSCIHITFICESKPFIVQV